MLQFSLTIIVLLPATLLAERVSDLHQNSSPAVVTIHTSDSNTEKQASKGGSGFDIGLDKIITAAHMVHTVKSIQIKDGYTTEADIISLITPTDVTL